MSSSLILLTAILWLFSGNNAGNPSYNQGMYRPEFLNYCYEERQECKEVCGCMLDRKCMVRPLPSAVALAIMDKHNDVRLSRMKSEPKASGMPQLSYDMQLEEICRCWAAKCKASTTDCLLTETYSEVKMNVGLLKIEDMNTAPYLESPYSHTKPLEEIWKTMLDEWIKEIDTIQFQQAWNSSGQAEARRGAHIISDQTLAVGCSWSTSPEGSFFYCAYGPGLKNGDPVYKIGQPCTTCPPGLKCNDDSGLCQRYTLYPHVPRQDRPTGLGKVPGKPPKKGNANVITSSILVTSLAVLLISF